MKEYEIWFQWIMACEKLIMAVNGEFIDRREENRPASIKNTLVNASNNLYKALLNYVIDYCIT